MMLGRVLCIVLFLSFLGVAPSAAAEGAVSLSSGPRLDHPEDQQLQASRLLNMLASMVRESSPFLARALVFLGVILRIFTNRTFLHVLLVLFLAGLAAAAAVLIWFRYKRGKSKAGRMNSTPVRRPYPPLPMSSTAK